ncbi:MAG: hypothetical protein GWN56_17700, partial [Nitrosopumilaceae archaeon]|nr:hypothetical protein [Nitrosopumilaceae archaeon]
MFKLSSNTYFTLRIILNFLPLLLVFFSLTTANSKDKYVFLITIDGLRPDA